MELIHGRPFTDYVRGDLPAGAPLLDTSRLLGALAQFADAMVYLHRDCRLLHRDLKPANVLVEADGRVVILDFGLFIWLTPRGVGHRSIAGTPSYMAPEQRQGYPVPESDWYSIGVMLFESLTGVVATDDSPPRLDGADLGDAPALKGLA